MFCPNCGRQNADNGSFCVNCGIRLPGMHLSDMPAHTQPGSQATHAQLSPAEIQQKRSEIFCLNWKYFTGSKLVLLMLLFYSAAALCSLYTSFDSIHTVFGMFQITSDALMTIYMGINLAGVVTGALLAVGMWMVYANGRSGHAPSVKGIRLIRVLVILNFLIGIASMVLILFLEPKMPDISSGLRGADLQSIYDTVMLVVVVLATGMQSVMLWISLRILRVTETNILYHDTNTEKVGSWGIVVIVLGGISALGGVTGLSLTNLLSGVSMVLMGVVMVVCKKTLEEIWREQENVGYFEWPYL